MKKRLAALLAIFGLVVALGLTGCGSEDTSDSTDETTKVGFMYVGPIGDAGWTYAHDLGALYMEENVENVEVIKVESVAENPVDCERVLNQMIEEGAEIIFSTSFGYMDSVIKVAAENPEVTFLQCSGYKTAPNVDNYFGRMYQPRYLSGLMAGKMTENNNIGYVAAYSIPEVVRGINAFTLGVREANPEATVNVVWTNTWYNPATEKDAAVSLLEAGADVIAMHQDTPGPMQAAQEAGAYGISYNTDMSQFASEAVVTGPIWNWGPYYAETVQAIIDGTWEPVNYWGTMAEEAVGLAPFADFANEEALMMIEEKEALMANGEWDVFYGPINNQAGELMVEEGASLSDGEMMELQWFVEGVNGSIN